MKIWVQAEWAAAECSEEPAGRRRLEQIDVGGGDSSSVKTGMTDRTDY